MHNVDGAEAFEENGNIPYRESHMRVYMYM